MSTEAESLWRDRRCWLTILLICPLIVLLSIVLFSCPGLFYRLLLHSYFLWNVFFCVLYGVTWNILKKRLGAGYPTQLARIKRLKTLPATAHHPAVPQKTFCWVALVDDDDDGSGDCAVASSGTIEQATDLAQRKDPEEGESNEQLIQDIRAWSLDHPCIIVAVEENVKIGDVLRVHLQDGDPSRPFYLPYQKDTQKRMKTLILKALLRCFLSLLVLRAVWGDPVFFADSQALEDVINNYLDVAVDFFIQTFPALADDDDESSDDDYKSCHITPYTALCYDALILLQLLIMVIIPASVYRKTNKFYGMEEPPTDSYHLLRGDEDEDELHNRNGNGGSRIPAVHAVVL